jgi:pyruvate dehydrogenase E1 component beta subunit
VIDTPISETFQAGFGIGLAASGMRPVIEFQFLAFMHSALDQIIAHASRLRHRTRGNLICPLVLRAPYGSGVHAPEHHSESTEALFAHVPGLRVIIPSTPTLAYHLLRQAIQCDDPIAFLEPTKLYRIKQPPCQKIPELGKVYLHRDGQDATILTWGAMTLEALKIADTYQKQYQISLMVVDISSLNPLDEGGILSAAQKTGRVLILHEAATKGSVGNDIYHLIQTQLNLEAKHIKQLGAPNTICPYYQNEHHFAPNSQSIMNAINEILL